MSIIEELGWSDLSHIILHVNVWMLLGSQGEIFKAICPRKNQQMLVMLAYYMYMYGGMLTVQT